MFCEKCGSKIDGNAKFCTKCGAHVNVWQSGRSYYDAGMVKQTGKRNVRFRPVTLAVVIVLIIIAAVVYFYGEQSYKSTIDKYFNAQFSGDVETI